jgi:hypothetical protein
MAAVREFTAARKGVFDMTTAAPHVVPCRISGQTRYNDMGQFNLALVAFRRLAHAPSHLMFWGGTMGMDNMKNGQRIICNGVNGTVIGKRRTRKRRLVLVKMDNGFTLKLNADTLSVGPPETPRSSRLSVVR